MKEQSRFLTFAWWNLHNFAHYDKAKTAALRWPSSQAEYDVRKNRIMNAIREIHGGNLPDLLGFCEVTDQAAKDLATAMGADYTATSTIRRMSNDAFQVSLIYRSGKGFRGPSLILPNRVTKRTRQMIQIDLETGEHLIRFVACHWTSFDEDRSQDGRFKLANHLREEIYNFLQPLDHSVSGKRHVVIMGDLNEEPMSKLFRLALPASRDHHSSRQRPHHTDADIGHVRLYNTSWRSMGEFVPFAGQDFVHSGAGTFYSQKMGWRTFDHLIVSGSLVTPTSPYLDEAYTKPVITNDMRGPDGLPRPYKSLDGRGCSDHLPIVSRLILPEDN